MADSRKNKNRPRPAVILGVALIALGLFNLAGNIVPYEVWASIGAVVRVVWPCALVVAGVFLLWASKRGKLAGFVSARPHGPFRRSLTDKRFLGVCGGVAYYFGVDSTIVRVLAVILFAMSPLTAVFAYFLIALVVPRA
ncbi:MAG: PspC domain-containing protein [Slackia sp.]|nr:PspC domain-containing protein [Slackia sp.]